MRLLEPWRRGGSHDVAAIAARLGLARVGRRVVGLRGLGARARCRACSTLDVRDGGGCCSAPPSRSEGVFDDAAASVPRIISLSLLNILTV